MLGWCMVLMAVLVRLPFEGDRHRRPARRSWRKTCSACWRAFCRARLNWLMQFLYPGGEVALGGRHHGVDPLLDRSVDWRDGGGLRVWRDPAARACDARSAAVADRADGDGAFVILASVPALLTGSSDGPPALIRIAESAEVSGVAAVPAHDARPVDRVSPIRRARAGGDHACAGDVRPRADVLLPAAHPADSRAGAGGVAAPRRTGRTASGS